MHPDAEAQPSGTSPLPSDQPPPSTQPNSSARPTVPAPDAEAPTDSGTAAQRTMKQTSKTVQEDGTARE